MKLGIDLMGADSSPSELFNAVLKFLPEYVVDLLVFLSPDAHVAILNSAGYLSLPSALKLKLRFKVAEQVVNMTDSPIWAIKNKQGSSMMVALDCLKKKQIDGLVTAASSGALITAICLNFQPIFKRVALLADLPTINNQLSSIIDVGANCNFKLAHVKEFLEMGIEYRQRYFNDATVKVGLLNIGSESQKGTFEHQKSFNYFQDLSLNDRRFSFVGNIEATSFFRGEVDLLLTDGFAGNILLKSAEGVYKLLRHNLQTVLGLNAAKIINQLDIEFDFENSGGAVVVGIEELVVKCHGCVTAQGFYNGLKKAYRNLNFLT